MRSAPRVCTFSVLYLVWSRASGGLIIYFGMPGFPETTCTCVPIIFALDRMKQRNHTHPEARTVCMSSNDCKSISWFVASSNSKGDDCGIVVDHKILCNRFWANRSESSELEIFQCPTTKTLLHVEVTLNTRNWNAIVYALHVQATCFVAKNVFYCFPMDIYMPQENALLYYRIPSL